MKLKQRIKITCQLMTDEKPTTILVTSNHILAANTAEEWAKTLETAKILMNLTTKQYLELVKELEEIRGLKTANLQPIQQTTVEEIKEKPKEKTTFKVILESSGEKPLYIIKAYWRQYNKDSLTLKNAKEFIDSAPVTLLEDVSKEEAENIKNNFEGISPGAVVKIQ
jgi:large subunit ribosomal protein L7/L12